MFKNFCKSFPVIDQFAFPELIEHSSSPRIVCAIYIGAFRVHSEALKYEYVQQRKTDLGSKTSYSLL